MAEKKRVYKKGQPGSEYDRYHGKPEQIKRRSSRNKARRKLGVEGKGGAEVEHKNGNPLDNSRGNLSRKSKTSQRKQGGYFARGGRGKKKKT